MTRFAANGRNEVLAREAITRQRIVVFQVAAQLYALPVVAVSEIVSLAQLSQPPGLPPVLAGFLNLGGAAIPVVRLARLLGLPEQPVGLYTPLILLRSAGSPLALLVDAVRSIELIDEQAVVPVGENYCFNDCAEGLVTLGESRIVLLSEQRLLREQEQRRIAELADIEQARLAALQEARP